MDRADGTGLGVAVAGHVALFGVLSLGLASWTPPKPTPPPAMEVEFFDEVALEPAAPAIEARTAEAPELGAPEDATPAEALPEPAPVAEPLPPPPPLELAPPPPAPKPAIAKPKPVPTPKPVKTPPVAVKPAPVKKVQPQASQPKKLAQPKKVAPTPTSKANAPVKKVASGEGKAKQSTGTRRSTLSLPGVSELARGEAKQAVPAPAMTKQASANIGSQIKRQVQPCANQQVKPGPGAERIQVTINLRLNRDGSLAARPRVTGQTGVDDENRRYADRVNDLAINTFTKCAPLRGLPADLYDVAKGWSNFSLRYKLPA